MDFTHYSNANFFISPRILRISGTKLLVSATDLVNFISFLILVFIKRKGEREAILFQIDKFIEAK